MSTISMSDSRLISASSVHGDLPSADRCEIVRDFARLEALAPEWDRLWEADPCGEVFQAFAWNRAWWKACGSSVELCTPVVFSGSHALGILPLILRKGRLEFLGAPLADYGDVICAEGSTPEVLAWSLRALQKSGNWREGLLDGLPEESRIVRYDGKLPADLRGSVQLIASERCYTILLGDQANETLDGLARKQHLRRRQNKLEKTGKVLFRHLETIPEALQHLELFFVCQRRRRAIHGKSSAADNEDFRQLLRNLVQDFDLRNVLHFGVLELDNKPIAWHLSFEANDKLVFYQQTFEVDAWDLAPGEAMLRFLLLFAKGRVHREFDFTRGDEPFKARFGNHERVVYQMWLHPRGFRGKVAGITRRLRGVVYGTVNQVRSAAKADKGIFERWRSARTWWTEKKQRLAAAGIGSANEEESPRREASLLKKIWDDETVVVLAGGALPTAQPPSNDLRVAAGGLGDLVDFAQENPHILQPTRVLDLRERFRKGDRAFVQTRESRPIRVAWVSARPLAEILQLPAIVSPLEPAPHETAMILFELWESRASGAEDLGTLLDYLQREARASHLSLWICCPGGSERLRASAEARGFRRQFFFRRKSIFGKSVYEFTSCGPDHTGQ
jgi:CelD/BcsL family acetyltransferase involved in cellulose biosynthesis